MNPNGPPHQQQQQQQQQQQPGQQDDWRSMPFRNRLIDEMEQILRRTTGTTANLSARDIEDKIYSQSNDREQYLAFFKKFASRIPRAAAGQLPQQQQPGQQQQSQQQQQPGMMNPAMAFAQQQQMYNAEMQRQVQDNQENQGMGLIQTLHGTTGGPASRSRHSATATARSFIPQEQPQQQQQQAHLSGGQGMQVVRPGPEAGLSFSQQSISMQQLLHCTNNLKL